MEHKITCGVPQGSVLGPLLWNAMYDGVIRLVLPGRTSVIGFADDIAVAIVAKTLSEAEQLGNEAVAIIEEWLSSVGLSIAHHKTEAVLISSHQVVETASIQVGGSTIRSARAMRYLGVMIDTRLTFREHIFEAIKKAANAARALWRIMLNTRGRKQGRRLLLHLVTYGPKLSARSRTERE